MAAGNAATTKSGTVAASMTAMRAWLGQPCTGTVETAAAPFWRLLTALRPDARIVVKLRRPVPDVVASLMALNLRLLRAE